MISAIAAMSKNRVLGMNGKIPWHIKGEQSRFRELTTGKTIIMGRRSYDEIGRPLPDRKTILISSKLNIQDNNCVTVSSLIEALRLTKHEEEVFISGGGQVYEEALPFLDRIYLTVIDKEYDGDIYFPVFDTNIYRKIYEHRIEGEIPYTYYTYEKYRI
ncbi:dihydrofolate reductase [Anaerocolumna cellulosilytica]|uniref:Dihydrofolate reductase n=1 Tax=Anaerocolumna cellulosilytica TaxID=433286 RepID=A0A6S6QXU4_9FIRM|nr:dihydrofolate reductase [Anaerocolumna cellulosilytica]MBB5194241.1 dihydrofolate reductase/dihydrofolate reductase (trimethoprim resistance protein) [Anaerocolumna cellulosilytica]BCJ94546.1 dihydrofolate reductase [Anaerocolumna cellulosilytica]